MEDIHLIYSIHLINHNSFKSWVIPNSGAPLNYFKTSMEWIHWIAHFHFFSFWHIIEYLFTKRLEDCKWKNISGIVKSIMLIIKCSAILSINKHINQISFSILIQIIEFQSQILLYDPLLWLFLFEVWDGAWIITDPNAVLSFFFSLKNI